MADEIIYIGNPALIENAKDLLNKMLIYDIISLLFILNTAKKIESGGT